MTNPKLAMRAARSSIVVCLFSNFKCVRSSGYLDELLGKMTTPKLVMRDEPNVGLRRLTARSSDTIKGVGSSPAEVDGAQAGD